MTQTQGWGNFTVGDLYQPIMDNCAGRTFPTTKMAAWIRKTVYELSKDYWFQGLQTTGPFINFTPGQSQYPPNFFMQAGDAGLDLTKVVSFFMYYEVGLLGSEVTAGGTHPGVSLRYKEIGSAENTMAIESFPSYWSRFNGQFFVSPNPMSEYLAFMRYQHENAFPLAGTENEGDDVINLDNDWQDIVEYAASLRASNSIRLLDYSADFKTILYGDPLFRVSGGSKGQPGLIFRRVSQYERDSVTATRSIQIRRS